MFPLGLANDSQSLVELGAIFPYCLGKTLLRSQTLLHVTNIAVNPP